MLHLFLSSLWRGTPRMASSSNSRVSSFVVLLAGLLFLGLVPGGPSSGICTPALAAPAAAPAPAVPTPQASPAIQPAPTPSVVLDALNQGSPAQQPASERTLGTSQGTSTPPDGKRPESSASRHPDELPGDPSFNTTPAPPSSLILQVTPRLQWLLDPKGSLSLGNIITSRSADFADSDPRGLEKAGTLWFRFSTDTLLKNTPHITATPLLLDLNMRVPGQFPGIPHIWIVSGKLAEGTSVLATRTGIYRMPYPLPPDSTVYIRINGLPGPGFAPMLRSPESFGILDDAGVSSMIGILGLALLISLARGILERREWRMWGALYIGAVLVQVLWGMPATPADMVSLWDLPGLLAPGVALLLLPHIGRTLMRTRDHSPFMDTLLILLAMPGVLLSVGPLLPGYAWTVRFLPLWPLCTLLLLPTTLCACLRGLSGARRFCFISVLPALGVIPMLPIPHLTALENLLPPAAPGMIPLATLALSTLIIAFASSPRQQFRKAPAGRNPQETSKDGKKSLIGVNTLELPPPVQKRDTRLQMALQLDDGIVSLDAPIIDEPPFAPAPPPMPPQQPQPQPPMPGGILPQQLQESCPFGIIEETLRNPLDALLREISLLDQLPLTVDARRRFESLSRVSRHLALIIGNLPEATATHPKSQNLREIFNLNQLLLEAHDAVSTLAERKNLALSWFTAPHMLRSYEGPRQKLADVLRMLAESAVLATESGVVQLRAQRLQESTDPGHLLFTISDTGKGTPPHSRSTLAVIKAWELATATEGSINIESNPNGTAISFSMRLTPRFTEQTTSEKEAPSTELLTRLPASALRIIIASGTPANRQMLAYYLDELPHEILETRNAEETLHLYYRSPGALVIFDDDIEEAAIAEAVASIRAFEGEHSFPLASILALVHDDGQAERLRHAGCTHILKHPVVRTELRHLTLRLAPVPRRYRNSFPEPPIQTDKPSSTVPSMPMTPAANTASVSAAPGGTPLPGSSTTPGTPPGTTAPGTPSAGSPLVMQPATSAKIPGKLAALFSFGRRSTPKPATPPVSHPEEPEQITHVPHQNKLSNVSDPVPIPKAQPTTPIERPMTIPAASHQPLGTEKSFLGEPQATPRTRGPETDTESRPMRAKAIARTEAILAERAAHTVPASQSASPNDAVEWVGEPVPLIKQKPSETSLESTSVRPVQRSTFRSESTQTSQGIKTSGVTTETTQPQRAPLSFAAPEEATEWVGEPRPIEPVTKSQAVINEELFPELPSITSRLKSRFQATPPDQSILQMSIEKQAPPESEKLLPEFSLHSDKHMTGSRTLPEVAVSSPDEDTSVFVLTERIASPVSEPLERPHPRASAETDATEPDVAPTATQDTTQAPHDASDSLSDDASDKEIFRMLYALDTALEKAVSGQQTGSTIMIQEAAASIGELARTYALRTLEDPAQCLELAAQEGNMDDINQLMSDLVVAIDRNRSAFEEVEKDKS